MMKQLVYTVIACLGILGFVVLHSAPEALSAVINTYPMHNPIYPNSTDQVTYFLDVPASERSLVQSVELWETISTVDPVNGTLTPLGPPTKIGQTWYTVPVNYPHVNTTCPNTHQANTFIQYEFKIVDVDSVPHSHVVGYAIRDYPPSTVQGGYQPTPVYVQGDIGQTMDIVFIPDVDIPVMDTFRDNCRLMILDGIFADDMTRSFWKYFNFFINPRSGDIRASGSPVPDNWSQLSFAEGHAIMHETAFQDYANGTLFITDQQNRAAMLHEAGHALFGLADEYRGGGHWETADYPNNWNGKPSNAEIRARNRTRAYKIQRTNWWKICYDAVCQMRHGYVVLGYDSPCRDRVKFTIELNAGIP
jgi:hypothetical protein